MGILDWGFSNNERYLECRQCGTTVEDPDARCAVCGGSDIAVYDF